MAPSDHRVFRLTAGQRRTHRVVGAALASAGLAAACVGVVFLVQRDPAIAALPILLGLGNLPYGLIVLGNARAVTECTPAGLRARTTRGKVREWPWPQVAAITVDVKSNGHRVIKRVMVMTTGGTRVRLVAPLYSDASDEEEFTAVVRQIQDYWSAATTVAGTAESW